MILVLYKVTSNSSLPYSMMHQVSNGNCPACIGSPPLVAWSSLYNYVVMASPRILSVQNISLPSLVLAGVV